MSSSTSSPVGLGEQERLILGAARAVRKRAIQEKVLDPGLSEEDVRNRLCDKFPDFVDVHPILFIKCCDTTFHLDKVASMLAQISAVKKGHATVDSSRREILGGLQQEFLGPAVEAAEQKRLLDEERSRLKTTGSR